MSSNGYADDALRMREDTSVSDIHEFIERRATDPYVKDGVTVWNLSTHEVDDFALGRRLEELGQDYYVIPYQVTPVWGYMQSVLPWRIKSADILVYIEEYRVYRDYPNYLRESTTEERRNFKSFLRAKMDVENGGGR